jgi:hypothetical protein
LGGLLAYGLIAGLLVAVAAFVAPRFAGNSGVRPLVAHACRRVGLGGPDRWLRTASPTRQSSPRDAIVTYYGSPRIIEGIRAAAPTSRLPARGAPH